MPQAQITINSVIGSNTDLPIAQLVQLDNNGIGGEASYSWAILDQPEGPVDSLSSPSVQNPTFTPKKQGTYLIRLIVNSGLANEQQDQVVGAVLEVKTLLRIPAAGETLEANLSRGWAMSTNELLAAYSDFLTDGAIFVGVNASGSSFSRGTVLKAIASSTILSGLPQQQIVPGFAPALATLQTNINSLLCVVEQGVDGATTVLAGKLFQARYLGRIGGLPLGTGSVGDLVYVTDAGQLSTTAGTVRRQIGSIMSASGSNRDVWFDGVGGADITPINAPYVVYGNPGMLTNAFRIDGDNASAATGGAAPTFASGDNTTRSLVAKRHGASQTVKVFEVQREDDAIAFFSVGLDGTVEWQTDTADASGVTVGAMDWRDVNSSAADKRVAQILGKLNGATANNRGGEIDVLLKANGASGLIAVVTFGVINALSAFGQGVGVGVTGTGGADSSGPAGVVGNGGSTNGTGTIGNGVGTGAGVTGNGGSNSGPGVHAFGGAGGIGVIGVGGTNAVGVRGTGNGTAAGVAALKGSGTDAAITGNGNLDLSSQSAPPTTTGLGYGQYNAASNCRAWASVAVIGGTPTVTAGQNIASVAVIGSGGSSAVRVTYTTAFAGSGTYASTAGLSTFGIPSTDDSSGTHTDIQFQDSSGSVIDMSMLTGQIKLHVFGR